MDKKLEKILKGITKEAENRIKTGESKCMLIDPCYVGEKELAKRYGSPLITFITGDGLFQIDGQSISVDSGVIHAYIVPIAEDLHAQGDLPDDPYAEIAYLTRIPTENDVRAAIKRYLEEDWDN